MTIKFTNNAFSTLAVSISGTDTALVLSSGGGSKFPSLGAGDYFYATLADSSNNLEIIKCTARTGDNLTVVRGQDGTTGLAYIAGDKIELRPVAADFTDIVTQINDHIADPTAAHAASAISNTPAGGIAATTVQAAINELDTEKFDKTGGTISGNTTINGTTTVTVAGAANAIVGATGGASNYGGQFTNNDNGILISFNAAGSAAANRVFTGANAGVEKIYCDKDGNVGASGNVTSSSDERLKKNWRVVNEGFVRRLATVKNGVYERIDQEMTQVGVSAQSLRQVLPEAVMENDDGMLSVAYGNAALVAAIELAKEVELLKKQIAELRG